MNFNTILDGEDDDLIEIDAKPRNNNKNTIKGADLLFNRTKISPEIASSISSISSRSSLSSEFVPKKKKIEESRNNNNSNSDSDSDNDNEDDDNEEDDEDDDDDDDEDRENNVRNNYQIKDTTNEKIEILYQLERLQSKGYKIPYSYDMNSDLTEMKNCYNKIIRDKEIDASIRFQRKMLMGFVTGSEYLNTRYNPFAIKLDGWSEQVNDNISDYDEIFEELHEKYKSSGKKMPPELRLFISLSGSAFMFHLTSKMFKESNVPDVEEVLKSNPELMKQFQNAAAKQYIYGNNNNQQSQPQQQRQQTQSQQPSLFGMIGNLFGGLNNTQQQSFSPPSSLSQKSPINDIDNIINNVHNKISTKPDYDNRVEIMSISDEEITSIIEDAADVKILKSGKNKKNSRTLNI
jgi:hypothetical protein